MDGHSGAAQPRRILRNAETAVPENGGELIIITCP